MRIKPIEKLQIEIAGYGFNYSLKKVYLTLLMFFIGILVTGYMFKLDWQYIAILAVIGIVCLPMIIKSQYQYLYEQQRFTDVSTYIEQMIYNFKKQPKILAALKETRRLFTKDGKGEIFKVIDQCIISIEQEGMDYNSALNIIYQAYPCSRVKSLHRFMIKIEKTGGSYQSGINVLLEDIGVWIERTYKYQTDRKHSRTLIFISICLATLLCYAIVYVLTGETISYAAGVFNNIVYQISMLIYLGFMLVLFAFTNAKLNGSWLITENSDEQEIAKRYNYINTYDKTIVRKKTWKKTVPLLILGVIAIALTQNLSIGVVIILLIYLVYSQPKRRYKHNVNFIEREVTKSFSDWMRDLMIEIPLSNVRVALKNTVEEAPFVLQQELKLLNNHIDEDPITIEPYRNFFKDFQLPEIKRPIQMLFSLNELGTDDVEKQLNDMIKQSNAMIAKSEDLRNEDAVSMSNAIVAAPMLSSAGVLAVVMFLFFLVAIGSMASQVLGG